MGFGGGEVLVVWVLMRLNLDLDVWVGLLLCSL